MCQLQNGCHRCLALPGTPEGIAEPDCVCARTGHHPPTRDRDPGTPAVRTFRAWFTDGPFAGRHATVTCRWPPNALYVLSDGGIINPDLLIAQNPAARAACQRAAHYTSPPLQPPGVDGDLPFILVDDRIPSGAGADE